MHELKKTTRRSAVRHQAGQKERLAAVSGDHPLFYVYAGSFCGGQYHQRWRDLVPQLAPGLEKACFSLVNLHKPQALPV